MLRKNLILYALLWLFASCHQSGNTARVSTGEIYTCPMHPTVRSDSPGSCPVCNMALVLIKISPGTNKINEKSDLHLDERAQMLAGIKTDSVIKRYWSDDIIFTGITVTDNKLETKISSRVKGRIIKVFVKTPGSWVDEGEPLWEIYSEELEVACQVYLKALRREKEGDLPLISVNDARVRLQRYGLGSRDIEKLANGIENRRGIVFHAPVGGFLSSVNVSEGGYVSEGADLFGFSDKSSVLVEMLSLPEDQQLLNKTKTFKVSAGMNSGVLFQAAKIYSSPFVDENSVFRKTILRIDNPVKEMYPGRTVYVHADKSGQEVLSVPLSASAHINYDHVWIKTSVDEFEYRKVLTGKRNNRYMEIISGIHPGEQVVTSGVYLLNSALSLRNEQNN